MARTRVKINSKGIVELLKSAEVAAHSERLLAPVAVAYGRPTHIERVVHGDRIVVQLVADDPKAVYKEAHTGRLARAFGAAGDA